MPPAVLPGAAPGAASCMPRIGSGRNWSTVE